MKKKTRFCR